MPGDNDGAPAVPADNAAIAAALEASVQASNLKMPAFWPEQPEIWFLSVEATFATHKITSETAKYNYVLSSLPPSIITQVLDIVRKPKEDNPTPYTTLKKAIEDRLTKPAAERTRVAVHELVLGDKLPSQLLRELQALVPVSDLESSMFRQNFISKMPVAVRPFLAVATHATLSELAEQADALIAQHRIPEAMPIAASAATSQTEQLVEQVIARINSQWRGSFRGRGRGVGQGPGRSGFGRGRGRGAYSSGGYNNHRGGSSGSFNSSSGGLCYYHTTFGDNAWNCAPGCPKNGQRGSQQ